MALATGYEILDKRMSFTVYSYSDEEEDTSFENGTKFKSSWSNTHPEYVAEDAAQHFYKHGESCESFWPVKLRIWNQDGTILGVFDVSMEYEPVFSAIQRKNP